MPFLGNDLKSTAGFWKWRVLALSTRCKDGEAAQ